ncbi:helix-turn-helix transcriptional regulator [Methanoculleus sp.]|jgi:transcriptional regulator with XRE-family HTH domain|uniref:helix-turn-helix domain-containing protein n=1 Tax=Methanoculleus sp. TaxID=90427 RepID=UPI0025E3EC00|nr:helix-turn-helix transcriptional regulator [Methanoculleus sp.]MCK9319554.1 helix-turn-helix domain-containing protein [Methanoculleus sp.]
MNNLEKVIQEKQNLLGQRFELLRKARVGGGVSVFELAKVLGFGVMTLYKLEKGESLPTKRTLNALKDTFKLTETELKEIQKQINEIKILKKQAKETEI